MQDRLTAEIKNKLKFSSNLRRPSGQSLSHLGMTKRAGVVKRDEAAVVACVHVGARLQQVLHHIFASKACRKVEVGVDQENIS